MIINKFNYEAYALDYLEGKLSEEMTREMESFLKIYPDIEAELLAIANFEPLQPDLNIVFESKVALLKTSEKIVLLKGWYRALALAASFSLLIIVYFWGYKTGLKNNSQPIAKTEITQPEKIIKKILPPPVKPPKKIAKTSRPNALIENPKINDVPAKVKGEKVRNRLNEFAFIEKPEITQLIDNTPITIISKNELVTIKSVSQISSLPLKPISLALVYSINDTLPTLEKELSGSLEVSKEILVASSRKKRKIRDLFGKFPLEGIKTSFIPTFYRNDAAGQ